MAYRHHIYSLSMLILLIIVTWNVFSFHSDHTASNSIDNLPDVLMEDVTALFMDKQGKPTMKIYAPKMKHFTQHDASHLTNPELTIYRKSAQPWFVTSKTAQTTDGIEHVKFWDDVVIQHAADVNSPSTLIKTTTLTVHSNDKTAETADPITLEQPNITVNATGMHADINTGDVKLLSEARGVYVPQN